MHRTSPEATGLVTGAVFDFGPDGLQFNIPAALSITYSVGMISNLSEDELRVHLASGTGWIPLLGTADTVSKTISASLNTLSIYGLKTIPAGGGSSGNGDATLAWLQSNVFGSVCSQCHIGAAVPMGVDWSSETASCANVGRSSGEVPALMEVASGNALASYVIWKVAGAGPNDRRSSAPKCRSRIRL